MQKEPSKILQKCYVKNSSVKDKVSHKLSYEQEHHIINFLWFSKKCQIANMYDTIKQFENFGNKFISIIPQELFWI